MTAVMAMDGAKFMARSSLPEVDKVRGRSQNKNKFSVEDLLAVFIVIINL